MRFVIFVVFCLGLLVSVDASAESAWWKCTASVTTNYKDDTSRTNGRSREFKAESEADAIGQARAYWSKISTAPISNISSVIVHYVKCTKPEFSKKKAAQKNHYDTPYKAPPPIPPAKAPKPASRTWTCRVKLTWQVGPRKGFVDEVWSDIEAVSEADAIGQALRRSQGRLMALTLSGTRPAWPKTDVSCS